MAEIEQKNMVKVRDLKIFNPNSTDFNNVIDIIKDSDGDRYSMFLDGENIIFSNIVTDEDVTINIDEEVEVIDENTILIDNESGVVYLSFFVLEAFDVL